MIYGESGGPNNDIVPALGSANLNVPAANTAAVITYAAVAGQFHAFRGVAVSYSAAPTGGRLTVSDGGTTVMDLDITAGGVTVVTFEGLQRQAAANASLVFTLAAGGGGIVGKLNVIGKTTTQ